MPDFYLNIYNSQLRKQLIYCISKGLFVPSLLLPLESHSDGFLLLLDWTALFCEIIFCYFVVGLPINGIGGLSGLCWVIDRPLSRSLDLGGLNKLAFLTFWTKKYLMPVGMAHASPSRQTIKMELYLPKIGHLNEKRGSILLIRPPSSNPTFNTLARPSNIWYDSLLCGLLLCCWIWPKLLNNMITFEFFL